MRKIFLFVILAVLIFSCNKELRFSKRLQKGEIWTVEEIKINDVVQNLKGEWYIDSDANIYDEVPKLTWRLNKKVEAVLEWQFQDKGKAFYLNYFIACDNCTSPLLNNFDYYVFDLSGKYNVEKSKRKQMKFVSTSLPNLTNSNVTITINKKD